MSPSTAERSRTSASDGAVMKSSSAASSSKRGGRFAAVGTAGFSAQSAPAGTGAGLRLPGSRALAVAARMAAVASQM